MKPKLTGAILGFSAGMFLSSWLLSCYDAGDIVMGTRITILILIAGSAAGLGAIIAHPVALLFHPTEGKAARRRALIGSAAILVIGALTIGVGYWSYLRDARQWEKTSPERAQRRAAQLRVAEYLERLMALEATQTYIDRAHQPDPDVPLVYIDFKGGVPDWQIQEIVRTITEGVHRNSSTGVATVVAQVRGITVARGEYKILSGAIEVKLLR